MAETDLYETDKEVQNLIDRGCVSEWIKENNNTIRNLKLEHMKELCKERNNLYEKQNGLKGQKWKIE